jgi:isohexenylglutaconyl-CoA hydratase
MHASLRGAEAAVQLERRGAFWFARLNRPDKRNALSEPMLTALADVCDEVARDHDARALVLWGAGGHFCAGGDFGRFEELMASSPADGSTADPMAAHNRMFGALLERLVSLPVPTIGVVRGAAIGGGCGLAATLDRVIATNDATFAMPEVSLGIVPAQIAPFVVRRIGAARASWLMSTGTRLDATAARHAGLVHVIAGAAELAAAVTADLSALALAQPAALRATRALVVRSLERPLGETLDGAAQDFARLLRLGAPREGIAASRERRPPAWRVPLPDLPEFT